MSIEANRPVTADVGGDKQTIQGLSLGDGYAEGRTIKKLNATTVRVCYSAPANCAACTRTFEAKGVGCESPAES